MQRIEVLESKQSHDEKLPAKVMLLQSDLQDQVCQVKPVLQCSDITSSKSLVMSPSIRTDDAPGICSNAQMATHGPVVSQLLSDVASLQKLVQQLTEKAHQPHQEDAAIEGGLYGSLYPLAILLIQQCWRRFTGSLIRDALCLRSHIIDFFEQKMSLDWCIKRGAYRLRTWCD